MLEASFLKITEYKRQLPRKKNKTCGIKNLKAAIGETKPKNKKRKGVKKMGKKKE